MINNHWEFCRKITKNGILAEVQLQNSLVYFVVLEDITAQFPTNEQVPSLNKGSDVR